MTHEHRDDPGTFGTGRLEAFSDGVFAIIVTLLVLDLHAPVASGPGGSLAAALAHMWPTVAAFVVSFMLVGVVWMNHHAMLRQIGSADHTLLLINLLLLLCVAVIPFTAALAADNLLGDAEARRTAAVVYGATLVVGGLLFNLLWWYAVRTGLARDGGAMRAIGKHFLVGPSLYAAATIVAFASAAASFVLYTVLILYFAVSPHWAARTLSGTGRAARRTRRADGG